MATGHLDPGYLDPVSRMARARNALFTGGMRPAARNLKELQMISADPVFLEDIRKRAREVWQQRDTQETTYMDHYKERFSAVDEPTPVRPSSSHRHNKPHPPNVFLTTRLHFCPGYHNPDTQMNKAQYKVDASLPTADQQKRAQLKSNFRPTITSAAANQYRSEFPTEIEEIADPAERQTAKAIYKTSPQRNQIAMVEHFRKKHDEIVQDIKDSMGSGRPTTVPSWKRYMRGAGYDERAELDAAKRKLGLGSADSLIRSRQQHDSELVRLNDTRPTQRSHRGDFLIHPEWPPSVYHHRLNGLSPPGALPSFR